MKEVFEKIRKNVRVLSEQEFCKRRKQEECDKYVDCETCLIDSVIQIVSEVEAEYGNGWIPFSERLPEKDAYCLVTYESGKIGIMEYLETSKWGWNGEFADNRVIAWMPLPSPYKPTTD